MQHECDVVIAGGSLASAAAAVAAGEAFNLTTKTVCFLEITDWPGGQASAGGIPAMDFGLQYLNFPQNIARSLAELLTDGKMGGPDHSSSYNPGECAYLPKCFAPEWVARWLLDRLAALPNVAVFLNTTVVNVDRDSAGRVVGLHAIQRTPTTMHSSGWDRPLSQALPDWYSKTPSSYFDKAQLQFVVTPAGVVVEATEFGDVLLLADGVAVGQGVELEAENSTEYDEYCGNPAAFSMFAEWGTTAPLPPDTSKAHSGGPARPLPGMLKVRRYWTTAKHTPRSYNPYHQHDYVPPLAPGDHYTVTSDCSDLANANVFLPLATARATARAGAWVGGMNLTAIAKAEAQMLGCYRGWDNGSLSLRPDESGTINGLSKMLYLRESRRSMTGVGGFRLCHNIMSANHTGPGGRAALRAPIHRAAVATVRGTNSSTQSPLVPHSPCLGTTYISRNGAVSRATSAASFAAPTRRFHISFLFGLSPSLARLTCWWRENPWRHRSSPAPSRGCTPTSGPPARQREWRPP